MKRLLRVACALLGALLVVAIGAACACAMEPSQAARIARRYLASDDEAERERLAERLEEYDGPIESVIKRLAAREYKPVEPGYLEEEHFSEPELLSAHPDDLLYFNIPKTYRPERPTGLIIFLHGGGNGTSRRAPRYCLDFPDDEDDDESYQMGDVFNATGMIAVGPSAPWDEECSYRWCLEEADQYLADVIRECQARFNIDTNRVILIGHSMGGFGAYHHLQRQPDRFSAVVVHAGSWSLAYLPMTRGTPLCIVAGQRDARRRERWHYTDVEYARWAHKLLLGEQLDHVYAEHPGEHALWYGKPFIAEYLQQARKLRRDPYYRRVALATPVGFRRSCAYDVQHNRWLSLDEIHEGRIECDRLISNDADDFDDWRLRHRRERLEGAALEAVNRGDNTFQVTTQNVASFTIWLHPKMIDFSKPVSVIVDGKKQFSEMVEPSLLAALESYERRGDWGLVYQAKIELDVPEAE